MSKKNKIILLDELDETNIERKKYNDKMQELLNELEKIYRKTLEKFKEYLFQFTEQKYLN